MSISCYKTHCKYPYCPFFSGYAVSSLTLSLSLCHRTAWETWPRTSAWWKSMMSFSSFHHLTTGTHSYPVIIKNCRNKIATSNGNWEVGSLYLPRTLEYLIRHLARLATYSNETNMHIKNLAIVWAPNLLRYVPHLSRVLVDSGDHTWFYQGANCTPSWSDSNVFWTN